MNVIASSRSLSFFLCGAHRDQTVDVAAKSVAPTFQFRDSILATRALVTRCRLLAALARGAISELSLAKLSVRFVDSFFFCRNVVLKRGLGGFGLFVNLVEAGFAFCVDLLNRRALGRTRRVSDVSLNLCS